MSDSGDLVGLIAGGIAIASAVASAVVWLVWPRLMGAIRDELQPMQTQVAETHKQVTENHHSNEQPTVLDILSDFRREVRDGLSKVNGRIDDVEQVVNDRIDDHLINASKADADMWRAIEAVAKGQPPEGL